jgi:hypothetical protein
LGSYFPFHETWDVPHLIALTDAEIRAIHVADGHEDGNVSVDVVATCSHAASKLRASGELSAPATSSNSGEKVRELSVSNRVGSMIDDMLGGEQQVANSKPFLQDYKKSKHDKEVAHDWLKLNTSGETCLQTIWNEIPLEIEGLQYLNITQDTIIVWNVARTISRVPLPHAEGIQKTLSPGGPIEGNNSER